MYIYVYMYKYMYMYMYLYMYIREHMYWYIPKIINWTRGEKITSQAHTHTHKHTNTSTLSFLKRNKTSDTLIDFPPLKTVTCDVC